MDPFTIDPPAQSGCTSCLYKEDASNYWTASIYFKSPENGTFRRVPQKANGRQNGTLLEQDGGLTIYYMRPFSGSSKKTTAMKPVSIIALSCLVSLMRSRASACSPETPSSAQRPEKPPASATAVSKPASARWAETALLATQTIPLNSLTSRVQAASAPLSSSRLAGTA